MSEAGHPQTESPISIARIAAVVLATVLAGACVGYFVGLSDGVPTGNGESELSGWPRLSAGEGDAVPNARRPIAAVSYAEVPSAIMGPTAAARARVIPLPDPPDPLQSPPRGNLAARRESLQTRASRRAFNGAPPLIPHQVEGTSDGACFACHSRGMQLAGRRASMMSHGFLANCLQCHAPPAPPPLASHASAAESSFAGLSAPLEGHRAFPSAPPTIPHATWMRENCNACHGPGSGWRGMQSNHPWRTNCTQCHVPSAELEQAVTAAVVPMLPGIDGGPP